MSDNFKFNQDAISNVCTSLVNKTTEYKSVIKELSNLVKEIDSSSSWKDMNVKKAFISSISSYENYFNQSCTKLTEYTNYLNQKVADISQFEKSYSEG